jgi:Tfp pilus assembly protein PilN
MYSRNTSPFSPAQRKIFWTLVGASALLGAATSFPFRQSSSSGAITSETALDQEIAGNPGGSSIEPTFELQQRSLVEDVATIAPLVQRVAPSVVLAKLTNALPSGVALSELSLGTRDAAVSINFTMTAHNEEDADRFINALRNETLFANVHLISGIPAGVNQWHARVQMMLRQIGDARPMFVQSRRTPAALADSMTPVSDRLQRDMTMMDSVLPAKSSIDSLQEQVVQLAAANSLQLSSIKALPSCEVSGCVDEPLELSIGGSFNGFYSFLLQLESLPRLKNLSQLQIRESVEHNGDMEAALRVEIFSKLRPE